jgi:two-component system NarL family sensor kinase
MSATATASLEDVHRTRRVRPEAIAGPGRDAAVIEERRRIAREIHDTLAQGLAAIRLQLEVACADGDLPPHTARAVQLAYRIAGENLVHARRTMTELRSNRPCLATQLFAAADAVRRLGPTEIVASIASIPPPPTEVVHELSRIAQEAMLNAMRHAEAQAIRLSLARLPGRGLRLAVEDDGKGFDSGVVCGFGLAGLRDRAATIGARLSITSTLGFGTQVAVTWAPQL